MVKEQNVEEIIIIFDLIYHLKTYNLLKLFNILIYNHIFLK